jgi:hypothetical protein
VVVTPVIQPRLEDAGGQQDRPRLPVGKVPILYDHDLAPADLVGHRGEDLPLIDCQLLLLLQIFEHDVSLGDMLDFFDFLLIAFVLAFIITILNFSIATGLMALTPDHGWVFLVICRVLVGFGGGAFRPPRAWSGSAVHLVSSLHLGHSAHRHGRGDQPRVQVWGGARGDLGRCVEVWA